MIAFMKRTYQEATEKMKDEKCPLVIKRTIFGYAIAIVDLFTFFCYNITVPRGSTTFTSAFVFKHQSQLICRTVPSITYLNRIIYFFSADFSEN